MKPQTKNQIIVFVTFVVMGVVGTLYYRNITAEHFPGEAPFRLGSKLIEDGDFAGAVSRLEEAAAINPDRPEIRQALGVALMQLGRFDESRKAFDAAIGKDPFFAVAYANRGQLNDRTGRYEEAIRDYRKALQLRPELGDGPGWLDRFLYNMPERPPTIADRARYLEEQLAKPESERLLRVPELDDRQRMFKP